MSNSDGPSSPGWTQARGDSDTENTYLIFLILSRQKAPLGKVGPDRRSGSSRERFDGGRAARDPPRRLTPPETQMDLFHFSLKSPIEKTRSGRIKPIESRHFCLGFLGFALQGMRDAR